MLAGTQVECVYRHASHPHVTFTTLALVMGLLRVLFGPRYFLYVL